MTPIVGERLIGSHGRGDADKDSDVDILIVLDGPLDSQSRKAMKQTYVEQFGTRVEISAYSTERLHEMYQEGHLFAWHVWQDGKKLSEALDFIDTLGKPLPCRDALADSRELSLDLKFTIERLKSKPTSPIFDLGIGYVCTRNIAIHMSWESPEGLVFSRNAPFKLDQWLPEEFPVPPEDYQILYSARVCRARPSKAPIAKPIEKYVQSLEKALTWAQRSISFVWPGYIERPRLITERRTRFRERVQFERELLDTINTILPLELTGLTKSSVEQWKKSNSGALENGTLELLSEVLLSAAKSAMSLADRSSDVFRTDHKKPNIHHFTERIDKIIYNHKD